MLASCEKCFKLPLMGNLLNNKQRKELLDELKIERSRRYADRIRVILLLDKGWTYEKIAEALFIDEGSIANYRKRYRDGGIEGLILDDYCTKRTKLTEEEETILSAELEARIYASTKEVIVHIKKKFKVIYSISGCNNLLHRLGFSFKKAKGVPGKAKMFDQLMFLEMYNELKSEGKIYFGDATHPIHNTKPACGWIKKGTEKEVLTNSGRNRVNIFGAICIGDFDMLTRTYSTINQTSVCDFLKALRHRNSGGEKLFLILDQGPSNKAESVKILAKELNIEIVFLPSYSPNLNPIERLWKFFKKKILYNNYYEKFKDFKMACASFFRGIRKYTGELQTLITDNFSVVGT